MEPQDMPPYAPLEGEVTEPAPAPTPTTGTPAATDDRMKTRRVVALAAGASFLAAMTGMAIARSGASPASKASTTPVPQQATTNDQPAFPIFGDDDQERFDRAPGAAQPGVPFVGGGQTQSRGS